MRYRSGQTAMRLDDNPSDGPELVLRDAQPVIEPARRATGGMLTGVLMLGALVGAVALGFYGRGWWARSATDGATPHPRAAAAAGAVPEGFGPVPQLDASDDFVRALIRQLSQKPEWAAWLASGDLIRSFVVSVDKIAVGSSPAKELKPAAPQGRFATLGAGRTLRVDPASYDRYNGLANVVDAMDPDGAARAYRRLRPLMQQAFDELGYVNLPFDDRLARALGRLVDVPVPEGDVMLRATSVTFQYADPDLEALSPAQKHMLRMGPHNMRLVQTKLRAFARAAGLTQAGT
ncbi:MAG: DUF3014 domain-containing protein [Vicinamibacteraceae bacterium]